MITTDYTNQNTFQSGIVQQYRLLKYIRDILINWFSDKRNIKDQRLHSLLYKDDQLNIDCIKIGSPFNTDSIYSGTTPSVYVGLQNIQYLGNGVNKGGNPQFGINPMQAPIMQYRLKNINFQINVTTQSYDGTVLLTELIQMFLVVNSSYIESDCNALNYFRVTGLTPIEVVQPSQIGNSKQIYNQKINVATCGAVTWVEDTQGPVFRGISNINKEQK